MQKTLQKIVKSPMRMMEYQLTGKLPPKHNIPQTPLIILLNRIPARYLVELKGIKLSPNLGYQNNNCWSNASQLLIWAKTDQGRCWSIPSFSKKLSINDLVEHMVIKPNPKTLKRLNSYLSPVKA